MKLFCNSVGQQCMERFLFAALVAIFEGKNTGLDNQKLSA